MSGDRIVVVDDAEDTLEVLRRNLEAAGYEVRTATSVGGAVTLLEGEPAEVVITDLKMPGSSGLDLVRWVAENLLHTEVIMITGYATVEGAVEAVKSGAQEYLEKPFTEAELLAAVERTLVRLRDRESASGEDMPEPELPGLVGRSAAVRRLARQVSRAAAVDATVLVTGESGTGKELVARAVHYLGSRSAAPFVPVNCGAIPENLMESELFGHVKGAFTGATASRAGFFQTAEGGTVFLDEVGETSLALQVRLLRVLQDKEVSMVGSNRPRRVDVRILAATNKELERLVAQGRFREDLYYRLNVLTLAVPALRERTEDVPLLARHFAERFAAEVGRPVPRFTPRVLALLKAYDWPGNVRELENVVQRLVVMSEGDEIEPPDLPQAIRFTPQSSGHSPLRSLAEAEADHIRTVLEAVGGNRSRAAKVLGIDRKTLRRKLERV